MTNWEFWYLGFPLLVYFKEAQTKSKEQPNFFPIIMDGKKLYEQLVKMPKSVIEKPRVSEWNLLTVFKATPVRRTLAEQMTKEQVKQVQAMAVLPFLDNK